MGFQKDIRIQPAPAVEGDFASANPRASVLAGEGSLIAGTAGAGSRRCRSSGVHASAYGAMVRMLGKTKTEPRAHVAMDSSINDGFASRFPTAGKLARS